jgi:ACT domain-containing protein
MKTIQHKTAGMTVVDACQEVGVARSTFYDFLRTSLPGDHGNCRYHFPCTGTRIDSVSFCQ